MSSDVNLDYLPEGFRDGGRGQYEAADLAAETARGIGRINASGNHFGGGTAGAFASALNHGAADRSSALSGWRKPGDTKTGSSAGSPSRSRAA
jgi:hypothetical protein